MRKQIQRTGVLLGRCFCQANIFCGTTALVIFAPFNFTDLFNLVDVKYLLHMCLMFTLDVYDECTTPKLSVYLRSHWIDTACSARGTSLVYDDILGVSFHILLSA